MDCRESQPIVATLGECESKHIATLHIPSLQALLSADLVYNGAHLYVAEKHIAGWLQQLAEFEEFATGRVATIHPGHGAAGDLSLISKTRNYLNEFSEVVKVGTAGAAEQHMLNKYPGYHVRQFLTAFSLPAFFQAETDIGLALPAS